MSKRYKWVNVGTDEMPEWAETTTGCAIGYHLGPGVWQDSAGCVVGSRKLPWLADFKMRNGSYCYVGCFRTGREAKAAAITAYENHWRM